MPVVPLTVTFAWHADTRQGPLTGPRFRASVLGGLGLLGLLELHLGLAGSLAARSQRVAAYLRHLRQHNNASRIEWLHVSYAGQEFVIRSTRENGEPEARRR